MYDSAVSAVQALKDQKQSEYNRVEAAHYLRDNPTEEGINALVEALESTDYGVHWAASEALAAIGEPAVPAVLHRLMQADVSQRTISGARHIFHSNSSMRIRQESQELVATMHDRTDEVATMRAAAALQAKLNIS